MKLVDLHNSKRRWTISEVAKAMLGLCCLTEASGGVTWPASWSDDLFIPPRNFEARKRSRRFLKWLISKGVNAEPWLEQLEEHGTTSAPKPWEGAVGRAYPIGDKVIKFTTDRNEAGLAAAIAGVDSPHLAMVYGVIRVADKPKDLYAIVQQKLNTGVSKIFRMAGSAVYDFLDRFNAPIEDPWRITRLIVQDFLKSNDRRVASAIYQIISAVKDVYDRLGVMYLDPHGANLAFKGRNIAFFDLGRSTGRHGSINAIW